MKENVDLAHDSAIPRIIHQIWYQGVAALPAKYQRYHQSWVKHHPHWEFRIWDEHMLLEHVKQHYPWFVDAYLALPRDIQRIDASRYLFLNTFGGVYIDMDIECLRPIDNLLTGHELILSRGYGLNYNNALMGSSAGHRVWQAVCDNLRAGRKASLNDVPENMRDSMANSLAMQTAITCGPRFFTMCVEESGCYKDSTTLSCPAYYFEPGTPTTDQTSWPPLNDPHGSYGRHDMDMNWMGLKYKILSKLNRFFLSLFKRQAVR